MAINNLLMTNIFISQKKVLTQQTTWTVLTSAHPAGTELKQR